LRLDPVPSGTKQLFRIAAGDTGVINDAVGFTGKDPDFLRAATIFYIEEILWCPDAEPYRVLGLNPSASIDVAGSHLSVLLDWLAGANDRHDPAADLDRIRFAWQSIDSASFPSRGHPRRR
jgi:hypothetical protein